MLSIFALSSEDVYNYYEVIYQRSECEVHYTKLGKSGMKVSRLCLGTMNFGPQTDEKEAFRIMDAALDAGVNFLIPLTFTAGAKILA